MRMSILASALALTLGSAVSALAADAPAPGAPAPGAPTPSPAGAKDYFINIKNGDHVKSPFLVQFGLAGMGIAPAGTMAPNTGHHHLIVDTDTPAAGVPIVNDMTHMHYGRGQTEATLTLPPGQHTLQLVMGDAGHIPLVPSVQSDKITITVDP